MAVPERATAADAAAGRGMSWVELLRYGTVAALVIVVLINVLAEIIPPLVIFALLWIAGLVWLRRATKGPAILLLVSFVAFIVLSAPFTVPTLSVPASAGDFILNLGALLAAIAGIVAAVAVVRGRLGAAPAARSIALGGAALFVVATAFSVFAAVTYDDAVAQEGDVELVTKGGEFEQTSIEAGGDRISVFVNNEDATLHTFTIDELDVDLDIPASKSARITFDAAAGTYEFYCVPHEAEGMKGTLRVR